MKRDRLDVMLRVLTQHAPATHEGRQTAFGLQQKKDRTVLLPGAGSGDGLSFDVTATAWEVDGLTRFSGLYINGSGANQNLYVTWHWEDDATVINRLKVRLAMSWTLVSAASKDGNILVADGTAPEWGVLKNWHGLGVGEQWATVNR